MKRNYLFKNTGGICVAIALLATTLLSSCMKDNSPGSINFGDSPALVGFQYNGFSATPVVTKVHGLATDFTEVEVTLSVATLTIKTPVSVTIVPDDAAAQAYFTGDGDTTGRVVPSADYSLANGGKITINPGQQIVKMKVSIAGNELNFNTHNWAIGLKITSVTGAVLATNLDVEVLDLVIQSPYEGNYTYSYSGTLGSGSNETIFLSTVSQYEVTYGLINTYSNAVNLTNNPVTNKCTVDCPSLEPTVTDPSSNYNPGTKTFTLKYTIAGGAYSIQETMVAQ